MFMRRFSISDFSLEGDGILCKTFPTSLPKNPFWTNSAKCNPSVPYLFSILFLRDFNFSCLFSNPLKVSPIWNRMRRSVLSLSINVVKSFHSDILRCFFARLIVSGSSAKAISLLRNFTRNFFNFSSVHSKAALVTPSATLARWSLGDIFELLQKGGDT